ncbi:MAG: GspH/FimT family pseudopilin [Zoogloeaceae bacterium]|nr:GspH/FimT family pseudopilin [Rhodocyclaceae bacterium]MCP5234547.1 GspH/FimT family pseudopilin [Zoogloeaceae bacterium]
MLKAKRKHCGGFTLVELLVTMAVVGIIAAVGVPSLRGFIVSNRLSAYANDVLAALSLARAESVRQGRRVVFCPVARAADGTPTTTACVDPGANSWQAWMVFIDADADGVFDNTETVVRADVFGGGDSVVLSGASLRNVAGLVIFRPNGIAREANGTIQQFNLRVCESGVSLSQNMRDITMVSGSRISVQRGSNASCSAPV